MPRYPHISVFLRSRHPLALVAAVRQALRRAGVGGEDVDAFSAQAFATDDPEEQRRLCAGWVRLRDGGEGG